MSSTFKSLMRRADTLRRIETDPIKTDWLADFERCVAWAWITRNTQLESKK